MTKLRAPVSIENTLRLVLGELTLDVAAELTGRAAGYLHALRPDIYPLEPTPHAGDLGGMEPAR